MYHRARGMTLIDVLVGVALIVVIFGALMGTLRASILLSSLAKARGGATSLMESKMEYLRGLSYDSLGTVGGIPPGNIPPTATTTMDNTTYTIKTYIQYVDDPADGLGVNDTNGITTDYKVAKVTVSFTVGGITHSATDVSNFAPPGIESTNGGGTLQINVVDATGAPVPGATVHITNTSTSPTVNLSTFSNANGTVYLPGAATSTEYQVAVSKNGYSSAQTYARTTTNQNPNPGYLTVIKDQTTTGTFAIDKLASLAMRTYSPPAPGSFSDDFADESKLSATSSIDAISGALHLSGGATSGSATSTTISPSKLYSWGQLNASLSASSGSTDVIHVYDGSGALLPDSVLPGNSTGLTSFPIDLSGVSTTTYPTLYIGVDMTTTSASIVPKVFSWSLGYMTGPTPLPNVSFTLTGTKTIGSTGGGSPIYKTVVSTTTDATGVRDMKLEWDAYSLTVPNYDIEDACSVPPYGLAPGSATSESLILGPKTTNRLLVSVEDASGNPVSGATVTLSDSGYSATATSSSCGNAYFGSVPAATDYTVTIAKTGYTTTSFTSIGVSGQTFYGAAFP